jgi:hypothetical protein
MPMYDPEAGKALLDEAGWTLADGANVRTNANGDSLVLKFTTTNAQFRQTWSAVMIQNLADCGIQIIPTYAPGSWWFGDTTGLARRDFELGAFAWVGQTEPAGRTLYACNQIPLPSNNWEGQNYMGWCNQTASDAVVKATNTLLRDDRIANLRHPTEGIRQGCRVDPGLPARRGRSLEFEPDRLSVLMPPSTPLPTCTSGRWLDGGDTIVIGMTQEPDSMLALVSSMAAQRLVDRPAKGAITSQYSYDFQSVLQDGLSTIESGLATNEIVEATAGDKVYDMTGETVELAAGVKIFDADGNIVEYTGKAPCQCCNWL